MKNKTIAKILKIWGYIILIFGTALPVIYCIAGWKALTLYGLLGSVFIVFSSLIGSCVFLAISRILLMTSDIYIANSEKIDEYNRAAQETNSLQKFIR